MAYYECLSNNDQINIGDKFNVSLTGSHNKTTTATVCYIYKGDKTTICLLGDTSLGTANYDTQCSYAWYYTVNINNKEYTGTCRIPTFAQIYSKCAGYKRSFDYWTSTRYNSSAAWRVLSTGGVNTKGDGPYDTLPFIEITL